jgi:hypothetical protein
MSISEVRSSKLLSPRVIDWLVLIGLLALVVALRVPALFRAEINMDDSNFLTMGRMLIRGAMPYVDFWDHNPLGGIALFGLAGRIFGYSYLTLRWLTIAAVAVEAFLLYRLGSVLGRRARIAGVVAAVVWAIYSMNNLGLAADRIFFHLPLITLAMYWYAAQPPLASLTGEARSLRPLSTPKLLTIGLFIAFSMQTKYLFPLDYAALALLIAFDAWQAERGHTRRIATQIGRAWGLLIAPAVVVLILNIGYFAAHGLLGQYIHANFTANAIYAANTPNSLGRVVQRLAQQLVGNPLAWLGLFMTPLYLLLVKDVDRTEKRAFAIAGLWFLFPLLGIVMAKRMDGHHFIQLLPPLSLLTGLVGAGVLRAGRAPADRRNALAVLLILLSAFLPTLYVDLSATGGMVFRHFVRGQPWPQDANVGIGRYLQAHIGPGESLFVLDYNPVLYTMVDAPVATPYPFIVFLIDEWYAPAVGIDQEQALKAIMARQPTYVVVQARPNREFTNQHLRQPLADDLAADYTLEQTLPGVETYTNQPVDVLIYRRNPTS